MSPISVELYEAVDLPASGSSHLYWFSTQVPKAHLLNLPPLDIMEGEEVNLPLTHGERVCLSVPCMHTLEGTAKFQDPAQGIKSLITSTFGWEPLQPWI